MKVTEIYYERVHNLGNYESERVGIRLELDEGEKAADVMSKAKIFVNQQLHKGVPDTDATESEILFAGEEK